MHCSYPANALGGFVMIASLPESSQRPGTACSLCFVAALTGEGRMTLSTAEMKHSNIMNSRNLKQLTFGHEVATLSQSHGWGAKHQVTFEERCGMPIGQHQRTALLRVEFSEMCRPCAVSEGREKGLEC